MYSKEKQIPVPKANLGTLIICWQSHQTQPSPDKTQKNPNPVKSSDLNYVAPQAGLEPATSWLTVMRSTDWAIEEYGIYDKSRRSPIFPRRHHLSIFGVYELNFCVRNGNRWNLIAICTGYHIFKVSNPENWIKEVTEKRNQKRWNKVKPSTD